MVATHADEADAASAPALDVGGATSRGRRRENQDVYLTSPHHITVADGVGGAPNARLAAEYAARGLHERLAHSEFDDAAIRHAVYETNIEVRRTRGQAAIAAVGLRRVNEGAFAVTTANLGDVRVYVVGPTGSIGMRRLSVDHRGRGNTLRGLVGLEEERLSLLHISTFLVEEASSVLVLTDGAWENLSRRDVDEALLITDADSCARHLVRRSIRNRSNDNVTVAVARVTY